ncbi:MAG: outer membrane lipoprotein-sorting protein [Planctomycetaceae bacterium]|nr:outer membrane lipoprotein-sorting protein [Planctomycetaceae bacterium]
MSFCTDVVSAQETKSIPISVAFFEDVAGRNRSNIESIMTIQGDVEIQYERYQEKEVVTFQKSKTFFAVDNKRNYRLSLRSLYEYWQLENDVKKKNYCTIDGYLYVGDIAYWYYAANPNVGDPDINPLNHASVIGTIRIEQRDVIRHDNSRLPEYFNPFDRMIPSRVVPSKAMLFAAKSLSHQSRVVYSVTQTGNFLTVKEESELGSKPAAHIYVFDTTKSYYLIEYKTMLNNSCYRYWSCEPILIDGIWFPSTVSEFTVGGKNKKEYRFSNVKINKKIPDDVFTLQFLGVRQKDHVFDTRTQTASEINDPAFPLPEYLKNLEKKSTSISNWILIGAGLFLIFCSLYRIFLQWRKKKTSEHTKV